MSYEPLVKNINDKVFSVKSLRNLFQGILATIIENRSFSKGNRASVYREFINQESESPAFLAFAYFSGQVTSLRVSHIFFSSAHSFLIIFIKVHLLFCTQSYQHLG